MTSLGPILVSTRVAPLAAACSSVSIDETIRDAVVTYPAINFPIGPENKKLHHNRTELRLHLQWTPAARMQLLLFRNTIGCVIAAWFVNGCFYMGNIFSLKSSKEQSRPEFLMATLMWATISYATTIILSHLPSLMTQRFLKHPDDKPSLWFCMKKLVNKSGFYFAASLTGMVVLGLMVQNTSLMYQNFKYKLHFYLGDLCDLVFTAGITLAVRRIYYDETYQGRDRRSTNSRAHPPSKFSVPTFWREYLVKFPSALLVALAGGYVHMVSWHRILDRGTTVIMGFAVFGIGLKLALQETARCYIIKKRVRSIRTMCVLVGVPTVLIDTQTRIVLLGTQTNTILISGTLGMAVGEISMRLTKAAYVLWTIRRRSKALDLKLQQISLQPGKSGTAPSSSLRQDFESWKRQVLSYHTAEITADMYAEYIAIGCSQSIVFWYVGHPFFPALQLQAGTGLSENDLTRWRFNQVAMLGFQFTVEILVDYVCVVLEMACGIEFDRIKDQSTFLGVLFMTMTVLNITISSAVYMC